MYIVSLNFNQEWNEMNQSIVLNPNVLNSNSEDYPFLRYDLYSLAVAVFMLWLVIVLKVKITASIIYTQSEKKEREGGIAKT